MIKLLPLIFLIACQDYALNGVKDNETTEANIEVTPSTLSFGEAPVGEQQTDIFTIKNIGTTTLSVTDVQIFQGTAFTLVSDTAVGRYEADESRDVTVTWTSSGGDDTGRAIVMSNDVADPEVYVDLIGGVMLPELTIDPDSVDFGSTGTAHTAEETVRLINTGMAPLTISAITETDSVFSHSLLETLPLVLGVGEEAEVTVGFTPTTTGSFSGQLQVESDDPEGMKYATLNGEAGSAPVAVCEADPSVVEAIHESTTWRGSGSYDPAGYAISEYRWTLLSAPAGSTARMPSGSGANRAGFTPDVVGTYEAQLVVANELGDRSDPCVATLEAEPGGDLWIEIFWDHSGDDMDLHLLAPSGSLVSNTDCYYGNCVGAGLDWGTRGDPDDNPSLDIDDIPGTGPENINISDPQAGTFTVYVHDYPGSSYTPDNDVTMNIYIGGALEWTDTRTINGEDDYVPFAEVEWPAGTVNPL